MTARAPNLLLLLASLLCAGGVAGCEDDPTPAEVGEACASPGETSLCVSGAVCTNLSGSDAEVVGFPNQCLLLCDTDLDCGDNEGCRGVSRSNLKACQPDDAVAGS